MASLRKDFDSVNNRILGEEIVRSRGHLKAS